MRVPVWRCLCDISYEYSILKSHGAFTMLLGVAIVDCLTELDLFIASTGSDFDNFGFKQVGNYTIRKIRKIRN